MLVGFANALPDITTQVQGRAKLKYNNNYNSMRQTTHK